MILKMKPYEHVPLSALSSPFTKWMSILRAHEVGHIYFLPHEDIAYRAYQFRDWCVGKKVNIDLLDMHVDLLENDAAFRKRLEKNTQSVVIMSRSFFLSNPDALLFFAVIETVRLKNDLGILILHEGFPSQMAPLKPRIPTTLLEHEEIYPLYTKTAIDGYIDLMAKDWKIPVKQIQIDSIYEVCGGNIWLVTDMLRAIRSNPRLTIYNYATSESFQKKMHIFWNGLPEAHRMYMTYGSNNDTASNGIQKELEAFGFPLAQQPNTKLPLYLTDLIDQEKRQAFSIEPMHITFKGVDISATFSHGQRRILALLSATPNEPVRRDALGVAFWQNEAPEKHSDWALDKIMSRLRTTLINANLPCRIDTVRGTGYVLRYRD